jgi:hypothetical protein
MHINALAEGDSKGGRHSGSFHSLPAFCRLRQSNHIEDGVSLVALMQVGVLLKEGGGASAEEARLVETGERQ